MDFQLTPDQAELREHTRKLCEGRISMERIRTLEGTGVDAGMWAELADAGVFALRLPESEGGLGVGMVEAALVFEELGRGCIPGPLVWSHLAAGSAEGIVGGVERGEQPVVVEYLEALDALIVLDEDGVWAVDPASVEGRALSALDPLVPVHAVASLPQGYRLADAQVAARWRLEGAALTAAYLAGMSQALCDMAVAYCAERQQFNRPVGSFQAVKHLLADMLVQAEMARTAAYAAAVHLDDPLLGGTERAVAAAKCVAGHAATVNGAKCIQAHGGMGFTWEVDAHLYLKRAWVLDTAFGSADDHADAMARLLVLG